MTCSVGSERPVSAQCLCNTREKVAKHEQLSGAKALKKHKSDLKVMYGGDFHVFTSHLIPVDHKLMQLSIPERHTLSPLFTAFSQNVQFALPAGADSWK